MKLNFHLFLLVSLPIIPPLNTAYVPSFMKREGHKLSYLPSHLPQALRVNRSGTNGRFNDVFPLLYVEDLIQQLNLSVRASTTTISNNNSMHAQM